MESAGARLKKIRLEKGYSLEDVHTRTKIHPDILRSLEDEALVNVNPVYKRGFLKIYCQFLGVNPADYLGAFREKENIFAARADKEPSQFFDGDQPKQRFIRQRIIAGLVIFVAAIVVLFLLVGIVKFAGKIRTHSSTARPHVLIAKPKSTKKIQIPQGRAKPPAGKNAAKTAASASGAAQASPDAGLRVGIQALDDVWVQARVDGKTVFQTILKKGRSESWNAKDKIELTIGSAGSVRLEVNGKMYDSLGKRSQVLKSLMITKDGAVGGLNK